MDIVPQQSMYFIFSDIFALSFCHNGVLVLSLSTVSCSKNTDKKINCQNPFHTIFRKETVYGVDGYSEVAPFRIPGHLLASH